MGYCCRHAPRASFSPTPLDGGRSPFVRGLAVFPHTDECDFCGEHPDFPAYLASLKTPAEAG